MYVKVKVSDKDPIIYELTSSEILIGSGSAAHLVILDSGLSKKHLKLFKDEDDWFAVDQGSTNGSYLGDEKLIPGKAHLIEIDIEIKLGHQVFITIQEEGTGALPLGSSHEALRALEKISDQDKTQIISLEDFKAAKILAEKQKKRELQRQRAKQLKKKKEDQNKIARSVLIGLLIVILGVFMNRAWKAKKSKIKKDTIVNKIKTKMKSDQEIDTDLLGYRISRSELIQRNKINNLKKSIKCSEPDYLKYCTKDGPFLGVHQDGINLIFFADEKNWKKKIAVLSKSIGANETIFRKIAFLVALKREFSQFSSGEKRHLYVAFYQEAENEMKYLSFVGAVDVKIIPLINEKFNEEVIDTDEETLVSITNELDQFYTLY